MVDIFFISDTHFGHSNILGFKRKDETPLRDFPNIEEFSEFGVCDTVEQLISKLPQSILDSSIQYVISVTKIEK